MLRPGLYPLSKDCELTLDIMPDPNVRAILLDIEGTTTPVEFVYQVLFPFARKHLREFIQQHYESEDLRAVISALSAEHRAENPGELESGRQPPPWEENSAPSLLESVTQYVYWLMDHDRKSTALKALQGRIWKGGYLSGRLRARVYPDVLPAFMRWQRQQRAIHIFSSGSILAQKLLFAHTTDGDLTGYISEYFDTTTGAKTDAASYRSISEKIDRPSAEVLFVSDVSAELDAAQEAGMKTAICVRQGSAAFGNSTHPPVDTFDLIFP
jgi:enolase-phosphatase E1